jgi:nicotinate-nucleotide pyrophosphorylase (carboxylating)
LKGYADVLLAGERVALNLMQRMCGVATLTRQYVKAVEGTKTQIVDTRKTTPGLRLLEKYAVTVGGGKNHRFGLDDGVLIKDNHIALAGGINNEGARNRVRLVRMEAGKETRTEKIYSLDDILKRKISDVELRSNDILEVPNSTLRIASRNVLGVGINMLSSLPFFIIR